MHFLNVCERLFSLMYFFLRNFLFILCPFLAHKKLKFQYVKLLRVYAQMYITYIVSAFFTINYLPCRSSAVARCSPGLLLLSVIFRGTRNAFATHARHARTQIRKSRDSRHFKRHSRRRRRIEPDCPSCDVTRVLRPRFRRPHF